MTLEDPFYVVKDEVFKALNKTRGLYLRWQEFSKCPAIVPVSPEVEWTSTELRNSLRSIEWDLEDLEDTISIVEKNFKFKIDNKEISDRRSFIEATKQEVKMMKGKISVNRKRDIDATAREPLLTYGDESPVNFTNAWNVSTPRYSKYSKLANQTDSPSRYEYDTNDDVLAVQDNMLTTQDDQLQVINNSIGSLKSVSKQIGIELDEQSVMLDDLNTELENTDSKIDSALKKVAKVLHMNNDKRQWLTIFILLGLLVLVFILFIVI